MKKLLVLCACLLCWAGLSYADDSAYFKAGPLELNIPLKTTRATYIYDFKGKQNLVGGESPFLTLWGKVEGTIGAVTSLEAQGTPFVGGNVLIGNVLDRWVTLPTDFSIGAVGGWNFNAEQALYGLKASVKVW